MYSYGGQQTYAAYDKPRNTYYSTNYTTPRPSYNDYAYNSSSSSSRSRESRQEPFGYAYVKPTTYTNNYDYERSRRDSRYTQDGTTRRHERRPSDEYYRGRASPPQEDRPHKTVYVEEDVLGYHSSPRSSPPPPYADEVRNDRRRWNQSKDDDAYREATKSAKHTTYTYSKSEKPSSPKKDKYKTSSKPTRIPTKPTKSSFWSKKDPAPPKYKLKTNTTKPSKTNPIPSSRPTTSSSKPSTSRPNSTPRIATAADAAAHSIPAGYSLKHWDPTLRPLILLGSVFDANSLGKWIYDWTVYRCGSTSAFADMAGELWLSLIGLAGRGGRGERWVARWETSQRRRGRRATEDELEEVEFVEDFLAGAERLWGRLEAILEACEGWMYAAARKKRRGTATGDRAGIAMGEDSGCEFVDSIFGIERELEETEKLMASVRLWTVRWDANIGDVVGGGR